MLRISRSLLSMLKYWWSLPWESSTEYVGEPNSSFCGERVPMATGVVAPELKECVPLSATSHLPMSWLKEVAPLNALCM